MDRSPCCIVATAAVTSVGAYPTAIETALRAGIVRIEEHPFMKDQAGDPFSVAMVGQLSGLLRHDRIAELAKRVFASVEGELGRARKVVLVYLVVPALPKPDMVQLGRELAASTPVSMQLLIVADGPAGGAVAATRARAALESGQADFCLVLGVDSWIDPSLLELLDAEGRIASSTNRWGFPPGEAAAAVLLTTQSIARQVSMRPLGVLVGANAKHRSDPTVDDFGRTLASAIKEALSSAVGPPTRIYSDINGERSREHEFSYAVLHLAPTASVDLLAQQSPAASWGDVGAATLPLLMAVACHGRGAASRTLAWAGSASPVTGAFIVERGIF